jgi:ribulose-phosphate 3-epimerase
MYEIIPSPGTENKVFSDVEKKIELVKPFAKTIHIDVVDGKFAPNTSFSDPAPFAKYTKDFIFEVHLMVEDPIKYLKPWADAGFQRFIGQIEKMSDQTEFVAQAQLLGEVGLAIDKQTSIDDIKVSLDDLDSLLVMTIQAGFSGQKFEEALLEKVKALHEKTSIPLEVDGGINDETIEVAAASGATRFVSTSFLFNLETPKKQFQILQHELQALQKEM